VKQLDPVAGEFQRLDRRGVAGLYRGVDFRRVTRKPARVEVERSNLRVASRRRVAAPRHVVDDGAGRRPYPAETSRFMARKRRIAR